MQFLPSLCYVALLLMTIKAAELLPARCVVDRRHPPRATIGVWLLVAIPSLLQIPFPGLYGALHRDSDLIMHHGQWWRPLTSFVVQDGGLAGTAFNLFVLAVVGVLAERVWGTRMTLVLFFGIVLVFSLGTYLIAQPPGGGNSIVTFRLAATVIGLALVRTRSRTAALLAAGATATGVFAIVALDDWHGEPMLTGVLVGALVALAATRLRRFDSPPVTRPRAG